MDRKWKYKTFDCVKNEETYTYLLRIFNPKLTMEILRKKP